MKQNNMENEAGKKTLIEFYEETTRAFADNTFQAMSEFWDFEGMCDVIAVIGDRVCKEIDKEIENPNAIFYPTKGDQKRRKQHLRMLKQRLQG